MSSTMTGVSDNPRSLLEILQIEWRWWVTGGIFSFVFASILMTGWPNGIRPELSFPYTYHGDGLSHSWLALRAIEGWIFDNPRSGYPFGSEFLDYPGSDSGNLLILKALGLLTGEYYPALNLYFLLSFSAAFIASYCTLRALDLYKAFAISAALLFAFLPFHFQRLGHLFYAWYFVAPIFFYLGFLLYFRSGLKKKFIGLGRYVLYLLILVSLASFGVYYALFGVIILGATAVAIGFKTGRIGSTVLPLAVIAGLLLGVFINLAPNLVHKKVNGENPEVAARSPAEAEIYGFKPIQLFLPRLGHRDQRFASVTDRYHASRPLVNENHTAALSLIGAAGLVGSFVVLVAGMAGKRADPRLSFLVILISILFLFGTIGGLGAIFSSIISSSIRGWNRISIFLAFGSIATFFILLQLFILKCIPTKKHGIALTGAALIISSVGLYDQTVSPCLICNERTRVAFNNDREFISAIEKSLPTGSAVYQLPYMPFPEIAPLHRLHTYDLAVGYLHSKALRWSYAGMKGREGDLFYRALAQESIEKQVEVISRMGFSGIYIDRSGYEDNADKLIDQLSVLLGNGPLFKRADGQVVFFRLASSESTNLYGLSSYEIMQRAGYFVDKLGARYQANLAEGIDFTRRDWPVFIRDVKGLSGAEPWGRWSDANLNGSVKFEFTSPLPPKFTLNLHAQAFGLNGEQEIVVRISDQLHKVTLRSAKAELRLPINLTSKSVDAIEFTPLKPVSPMDLGAGQDTRKLGIGFVSLRIE